MKLHNRIEIADFLNTVNRTKNNVYLRSPEGDCYNLKSTMSQYIAIAALLKEHGSELELFCDNKEDEKLFFGFFMSHPDVLE